MIHLSFPYISNAELKSVKKVLKSKWLIHGPEVKNFENDFARYIGVKYAIAMNSCTSALQLAIKVLGKKGEIIVPGFTFAASVNAIVNEGCIPKFVDIEYETCNIDPTKIEKLITSKTIAIMVVHYAGQSCRMEPIIKIAKKHNITIIEDSAEAIGAEYKGKKTGTFGIGCFSLFPTKNMTAGEGGVITINNKKMAEKIRLLIAHGISKDKWTFKAKKMPWNREAVIPGYNFRMTDIQGAIANVQLKKLDRMNEIRREIAYYYSQYLPEEDIVLPTEDKDCKHVYQMYTIKIRNPQKINRDKLVLYLISKGIQASVHFDPPVHKHFPYRNRYKANLPVTDKVSATIITLPMHCYLKRKDCKKIAEEIKKFILSL